MGLKEENAFLLQQVADLNAALQKVMLRLEARDSGAQDGSKVQPETNSSQTARSLTSEGTNGTKGKSAPGKGSGKGATTSSGKGIQCLSKEVSKQGRKLNKPKKQAEQADRKKRRILWNPAPR